MGKKKGRQCRYTRGNMDEPWKHHAERHQTQKATLHDAVYVASTTQPNPQRQKSDEWHLGVRGTLRVEREGLLLGAASSPSAFGWGVGGKGGVLFYLLIFWPRLIACGTLVPQPGIKPLHPAEALEAQTLNPWTTRGVSFWGTENVPR